MSPSPSPLAERLRAIEETLQAALTPQSFVALELAAAMRYAVFPGGQRWRPLLTLAAAEMAGAPWSAALNAAAATELVHCCSLVFDDLPCMDDAKERRGLPPVHVRFNEGTAALTGLALLTTAYGLLARTVRPGRAVAITSRYLGPTDLLTGQAVDLHLLGRGKGGGDRQAYAPGLLRQVQNRKTSALVKMALHLGALHGRVTREQSRALTLFGREIGNAYQLMDDLHDLWADCALRAECGAGGEPENAATLREAMERHLDRAEGVLCREFPASAARGQLTAFAGLIRDRAAAAAPALARVAAR